jgi:single-stranded-DNA-specific exonuclease
VDSLGDDLNGLPAVKAIGTLKPVISIDGYIAGDDLCLGRVKELERLKPFGVGNPAPVLCYEGACILEKRSVGGRKHLKMVLDCDGVQADAIAFNMGDRTEYNNDGVDVAFRMELNTWGGKDTVRLNLVDIRPAERVVSEERYYESLCKCLEYFSWESGELSAEKDNNCSLEIPDRIRADIKEGKTLLFLINNLKDLHQVANFINISSNDIKKRFKICYNEFGGGTRASLVVLANPLPGRFRTEAFDSVVLYGKWLDKGYLERVAGEIGNSRALIYSATAGVNPGSDIIPDRDELALLYRYLKSNPVPLRMDDMPSWVRDFNRRSGVKSNLFKVRKSLEIFKELSLLDVRHIGKRGIEVLIKDYTGEKRDLMDSEVFRKLQLLKREQHDRERACLNTGTKARKEQGN